MSARRIAFVLGAASAIASGWYFFVYLTRWEWNRAIVSGLIFLAAEIALVGGVVLERLGRVGRELAATRRPEPRPELLARVREAAPPSRSPFAWLDPDDGRLGVFVPVLLGAGVIVSAVAWVVERVARATARPSLERGLALRLGSLALPEDGLVPEAEPADPLGLLAPEIPR
ncbi:MAG: hypothetical protein M5U14_12750 [Acidimicrobiia bacterium]|nr:hypothetical protein [Acidimicrobiia bacterium]